MLRIIDANLDRLSEGLRVLEEVCRFILDDAVLTEKLRGIRHGVTETSPVTRNRLLASRDSARDVGRNRDSGTRRDTIELVAANAKRAEEALRVLEEFGKLPGISTELGQLPFEHARFALYEIEKELVLKLSRQEKRDRISGLYVIVDREALGSCNETEVARQIAEGGGRIIQFRDKQRDKGEMLSVVRDLGQICSEAGSLFIINDAVDVALAAGADGVHIGQNDLPVSVTRGIVPQDKIIGCSVRTVDQALRAQEEGADYLGVGAIYPSPTKPEATVIGLESLRDIRRAVALPIVALGGINEANVGDVLECGADSVAVIDAVLNARSIPAAVRRLISKIESH